MSRTSPSVLPRERSRVVRFALLPAALLAVALVAAAVAAPTSRAITFVPHADYLSGVSAGSIAAADFNGDGSLDLMLADSMTSNYVRFAGGDPAGRVGLSWTWDYLVPGGLRYATVADFNGDGVPDTAITHADEVLVGLGAGDGSFGSVKTTAAAAPASIAAADFNEDGKQDIVTVHLSTDEAQVFLGAGDGAFGAPATLTASAPIMSATSGDFDGDHHADVAFAEPGANAVAIFYGDGAGGFSSPVYAPTDADAEQLGVGDFNGDGCDDLAIGENAGGIMLRVTLCEADRTFQATTQRILDTVPSGITTGDFDGDGNVDIAASQTTGTELAVLPGNGDGTFGLTEYPSTGPYPYCVTSADMNDDGRLDLVDGSMFHGGASVLLGTWGECSGTISLESGAAATGSRVVQVDCTPVNATQVRLRDQGGAWGGWQLIAGGVLWTLPAGDGTKTVQAQFRNPATVDTATPGDSILLDQTAPVTTDDAPSGWRRAASVDVKLAATDAGSGVAGTEYKLDGAGSWSDGAVVHVAGDGVHTIAYRSTDKVGNVEATATATVKLDTTPPWLTVAGPDDAWHAGPVLVTFAATDAGSGVAVVAYRLDGGQWTAGVALLVAGDGEHALEVRADDAVGNECAVQSFRIKVDATGPVTSGSAVKVKKGKPATFKVLVSDPACPGYQTQATIAIRNAAGKTVKTLPAASVTIGTQASVTWARCTLKPGAYRYVVTATDAAGNPPSSAGGGKLTVK